MAIEPILNCQFPQDLDAAAKALEQEIGDRFKNSLALLRGIEDSTPGIAEGINEACNIMAQLMANGDGSASLKTCGDVSKQFGLPKDPSDPDVDATLEDERLMHHVGAAYVDGVMYIPGYKSTVVGDSDNIEVLRRLYFALGRDFAKVADLYKSTRTAVIHNLADVRILAPKVVNKEAYTFDEVVQLTGATYLAVPDVYVSEDFYTYVMLKGRHLATNASLAETKKNYGLTDTDIVTSVFHFGSIDNAASSIDNYSRLGYSGEKLSSILNGSDLVVGFPEVVDATISSNKLTANNTVGKIDFILSRYESIPNLNTTRDKNVATIKTIRSGHVGTIADSKFQVTLVQQKDTLDRLRAVHGDDKIKDLLEKRLEVLGVYFSAPDALIFQLLAEVTVAVPGSTMSSNGFLTRDSSDVYNNHTFLIMAADLHLAQRAIEATPPERSDFQLSRQKLVDFTGTEPKLAENSYVNPDGTLGNPKDPKDVYQGQPSLASPGSILATTMETDRVFRLELRLGVIDDLLAKLGDLFEQAIAKPLAHIIGLIAKLFKAAMRACKLLQETLEKAVLPIKRKVDAFMSQFLSLTGSGVFESSLLKCAINFDIGVSTSLLDDLLQLIDLLSGLIGGFISAMIKFVADFIENFLCLPINMINAFIGKVSVSLPSFCQTPTIDIGDTLTKALEDLRAVADLKQASFTAFSGDLIRFRAIVDSAPDKVTAFKSGGLCNSGGVNKFYGAAVLNLSGGRGF